LTNFVWQHNSGNINALISSLKQKKDGKSLK